MLALVVVVFCYFTAKSEAIIGGKNASTNQFPYIVSLQNAIGEHVNAGSIISKKIVITDAYTLHPNRKALFPVRVLAGTNLLQGAGLSYRIKAWIVHPRYNEISFLNNIGLVQIDGKFNFNTDEVKAIPLGIIEIGPNVPVIAAGWGLSETSLNDLRTAHLKFATLLTINETNSIFHDTMYEGNHDYLHAVGYSNSGAMSCQWDMGGPIEAGYTLVGIITWDSNKTCSYQSIYPTTALRVQPFIGWINEIIYNVEDR